jgi:NADH:ubiquinone oxidoreductase subunit 6 (subunit J)
MHSKRPRRPNPLGKFAAIVAICLAAGGVVGAVTAVNGQSNLSQIILALVLIGTLVVVFVFSLDWWRGLDEAAQEAHKWAWWWGGSAGMSLGLIVLVALLRLGAAQAIPESVTNKSPEDLIYLGAMGMLVCQMAGYVVAWAAWWLRRR